MLAPGPSAPPIPPANLLGGVGWGDFWENGFHLVELIERHARIEPDDRVLDVGCGLGRVAWPLSQHLHTGTYDGIDTVRYYHAWTTQSLGLDPRRFRFHLADVYSSFYNPRGATKPEAFRFPWPDATFTLAIATSLLTHLSPDAAANYIRELARVLAPGGRLFASFFLLDDDSREVLRTGPTVPPFTTEVDRGCLSDPANPDFAIALDAVWLRDVVLSAGFEIAAYAPGTWRRAAGPTHQDIAVLTRL